MPPLKPSLNPIRVAVLVSVIAVLVVVVVVVVVVVAIVRSKAIEYGVLAVAGLNTVEVEYI